MPTHKNTFNVYDRHAEEYFKHVSDSTDSPYHTYYEKPAIRSELPVLKNKSVICLGCASGEDCQYLKSHGANRVVGIDLSKKLLTITEKNHPDCEFKLMDMEKLDFDNESFDLVYSGLAIHYIIGGYKQILAEAFRVLKPGGRLLISTGHPIESSMTHTSINSSTTDRRLGYIVDLKKSKEIIFGDYLTSRQHPSELFKKDPMMCWLQPLSATVNQIIGAGFVLDKIIEPLPKIGFKKVSERHYSRLLKIPEMIIFKAHKP